MTKATRRGILAVVTAIVLLALGAGLGIVVGDALGIRTEPATQMDAGRAGRPAAIGRAVPAPRFTTVDAPDGPPRSTPRSTSCADAAGRRRRARRARPRSPSSRAAATPPTTTYRLDRQRRRALRIEARERDRRGARHLRPRRAGAHRPLRRRAPRRRGHLAAAVPHGRHGRRRRRRRTPPRGSRAPTTRTRRRRSRTCCCPRRPTSTRRRSPTAYDDFDVFIRHSLANGYNAVAFPGFVEFVTFDEVAGRPGLRRGRRARRAGARAARGVRRRSGTAPTSSAWRSSSAPTCSRSPPRSSEYLDRPVRLARHREPRAVGRLRRRPRRALRRGAGARRRPHPHRRGGPGLRRRGLGLLLRSSR